MFTWPPAPEGWQLPWSAGDKRPLILASLSTMPRQTTPALLQHVLDALAPLPAHVLMTTGAIPPGALTPPANAAVAGYLPHPAVLPHASLMITHGGHRSVTAALAQGVPLVCMPGAGADQPVIGARVEALGAGKTVSRDARANEPRDAAWQVLTGQCYRRAARRLAHLIHRQNGAANGAIALEDYTASAASTR